LIEGQAAGWGWSILIPNPLFVVILTFRLTVVAVGVPKV
jgi:hypothetical protein